MKNITLLITAVLLCALNINAQQHKLSSPDGKLTIEITTGESLKWQIAHEQTTVLMPSDIAMHCIEASGKGASFIWGKNVKVTKSTLKSINTTFATPFYKKASVEDVCNELTLKCNGGYSVQFRAYNDGAAYRFISERSKPFCVKSETADFNFDGDHLAFIPYVNDNRDGERFCYSFESYYDEVKLSEMFKDSLAITPLMVKLDGGKKAVIMEAGLSNYPGMFLQLNSSTKQGVQAVFAPRSLEDKIGGHARLNLIPTKRDELIYTPGKDPYFSPKGATGKRDFAWRVVLVTTKDTQLADNDMMQRLAPKCRIEDTSWIKPGKVAWDWWNTCNLTGVDFKAGMNTPTYKKYIDFAAANNLEYIIIDEGWSGKESLMEELNSNINLEELIDYSNKKSVGIILWASWRNITGGTPQHTGMEEAMKHYANMGIKGFKVDFFDRDDQAVMASTEILAACAAKHHLLLNLHGLKPFGIQKTYPNIMNFEGVKGLENAKWEPIVNGVPLHDFPRYDVTAPYLRQLVGPMDYTPGATVNATRETFRAINDHPMSQGTRVHQMAMYTIFEAPLQMLADSPSKYMKEQECTSFIAKVPTTFDETVALDGEIAEFITIARRKADTWFVGCMTNWNARQCTIDLSFLADGSYEAEIFADGINADREATDYKRDVLTVTAKDVLNVQLAPGGGWTARITKK